MGKCVEILGDYEAAWFRDQARRSKDANQARRLLSLAAIKDGKRRHHAAKIGGMDRQTLRDWVHRFNAEGIDGLLDRKAPGARFLLSPEQGEEIMDLLSREPVPEEDGTVRWRLVDLCAYTIIKDYIREHERRSKEVFVPLAHPRGCAQADFGEAEVVLGGVRQKVHFFVFALPYSDTVFVRAYKAAVSESWMDGHVHAFSFFGAVPTSILYDNDRCLVVKIHKDGKRRKTLQFKALISHYLFKDRYGRPGRGNDKGTVEGLVGYNRFRQFGSCSALKNILHAGLSIQ